MYLMIIRAAPRHSVEGECEIDEGSWGKDDDNVVSENGTAHGVQTARWGEYEVK